MTLFSRAVSRFLVVARTGAVAASALLILPSCAGLSEAMSAHTDVVARAAGNELRVEEAAQMLASNPEIPADPQVVRALADLWIDYTLFAVAVAEDSTLAALDLASFIQPVREQALVTQLRDLVIEVDTVVDDAELERRWAIEGPSAEIHARHILLRTPTDGSGAQRDSVRAFAESLRQRAESGESFDELARQYSQDPGSAARGGDLGFFSRGRMVEPFEEAAFQLSAGEISPVVETPFGYHVILVEERRQPDIGAEREQFRQYLVQQQVDEAERAYLDSLAEGANVQIQDGGLEVVREIASRPDLTLRGRSANRQIATYDGGELTAGEFHQFLRAQPAQIQSAFASAPAEQLETGVRQLVQMELLMSEAQRRGLTLSAADEERIRTEARQSIRELVDATGFAEIARAGANQAALDGVVKSLVQDVVAGEAPFVPLGRFGVVLRDLYPHELNDGSFPDVISRLEQIRASQPPMPQPGLPGQVPQGMPPVPGDTGGAGLEPALPEMPQQ
ncbi:MAG TPA: peptidylprolyl isomerase [Longimicrobiaceae bacterium]|nr:peptidylprolyl isomerase [Longimicrobiaceae bacterium]